jgi:hypothetical protein
MVRYFRNPWEHSLEKLTEVVRREDDKQRAQHDSSDQEIAEVLAMALQPQDRLFLEKRDSIAQAIHEKYLQNQQGKKPSDDPAMTPWETLLEPLKESNRDQADQIIEKLRRIECDIRLPGSNPPAPFAFKPEEVEILAEMEHDRWVAERLREGWRTGPRDPEKKLSPYLVAWNDLEEEIRDYDRQAVLGIPGILAKVGLEVYRPNSQ